MTARDRLLIGGLAVLAVLAGVWFMLLAPARNDSGALDTQITASQAERDTAVSQAAALATAQHDRAANAAAIAALGKALPADDQTASLLYQLDAAAGRSRVTLQSISPAPAAGAATPAAAAAGLPAGVTAAPVSLTFRGRFADLQRFLRRVQGHISLHGQAIRVRGRLVSIDGVHLTSDPEHGSQVDASIDASVFTASATAPAAPGAPAAPAPAGGSAAAAAPVPTQPAAIGVGR